MSWKKGYSEIESSENIGITLSDVFTQKKLSFFEFDPFLFSLGVCRLWWNSWRRHPIKKLCHSLEVCLEFVHPLALRTASSTTPRLFGMTVRPREYRVWGRHYCMCFLVPFPPFISLFARWDAWFWFPRRRPCLSLAGSILSELVIFSLSGLFVCLVEPTSANGWLLSCSGFAVSVASVHCTAEGNLLWIVIETF